MTYRRCRGFLQLSPPLLNFKAQTVQYTPRRMMFGRSRRLIQPARGIITAARFLILPPGTFHWLNYSVTAYQTGAVGADLPVGAGRCAADSSTGDGYSSPRKSRNTGSPNVM